MTYHAGSFSPELTWSVLVSACRDAGLDPDGARLMRLGENALYELATAPVVVRVARTMDYWANVQKEVRVARWLGHQGFPAGQLTGPDSQPCEVEGYPVTFWEFIPGRVAVPDDVGLLGEVLRRLHRLAPPEDFQLPDFDVLARVRPRVASAPVPADDKQLLLRRCDELRQEISDLEFPLEKCATHGDAHIKNLMLLNDKPLLIDFENFSWGHPEWDLAMTATEYITGGWWTDRQYKDFSEAYGFDILTWPGFATLRSTHEIKMTTWIMQNVNQSDEIRSEYESRMHTIRTGEKTAEWRPF